jgi:transcriptional regulator with XRE-family HTH domain
MMPKDIGKLIGIQVARIRKEREITQEQLAESVDVATETISRLERGVSIPSLITLSKISQALHISLKDLFDFEYPQKPVSAIEKESMKLLAYLKTKKVDDIKMCYRILKNIFEQIEKDYRPKR